MEYTPKIRTIAVRKLENAWHYLNRTYGHAKAEAALDVLMEAERYVLNRFDGRKLTPDSFDFHISIQKEW